MNEPTNATEDQHRLAALKRYRAHYRALHDELVDILFHLDPIGVHADEAEKFVPEATTIMARLREARLADDVEQIVQQELRRWYGRRRLTQQDPERLTDATIAICRAWNHFLEVYTS
jgi:hypothetical protein